MKIKISYFALLREERGLEQEELEVSPTTAEALYSLLAEKYSFSLRSALLRAAVNEEYVPWDYQIKDGDEVVFIPPGGGRIAVFEIVQKPIEPDVLRNKLKDPAAGALVVFEGMVRNNHQGQDVLRLEYQAFGPMAVKEGEKILMEATDNFGLLGAFCQHRVGVLEIGEVAVWIGVITGHRQEGFEACRFIIDEIKKSVPIWKKEYFTHGSSHWVKSE